MGPYLSTPQLSKTYSQAQHNELTYATCEMQGWRRTMEDADIAETDIQEGIHLFAVFDGHGGSHVSKFVAKYFVQQLRNNNSFRNGDYKQALIENFKRMDDIMVTPQGEEQLKNIFESQPQPSMNQTPTNLAMNTGCTANVLLITPTKYYVANAGDSRSVLCVSNSAVGLSVDHKPDDPVQYQRIQRAGGSILNGRVNGGLNLTRSLGDFAYKRVAGKGYDQQLVICKPDVKQHDRSPNDEFIVMGCDGVWQKYVNYNQGMVEWIKVQKKVEPRLEKVAEMLLDFLVAKNSSEEAGCDNMTVILIEFKHRAK